MNTAQKHFFIYDKIEIDPYKTKIYAEGWQSWSVAETLNIGEIPYRATDPDSRIIDCQNSVIAGEGIFQGSGLLGIQIQDSGPIYLYHLNNLTDNIPIIRAKKDGNYLIISTDGSITHQYFDSNEEPESALKLFAENFIHNVLPEKSTFFKKEITIPAIWCTWYGYYDKVIPQNIYDNMTIIENNNLSIDIIQIDDGYQLHAGDWLYPSANFTNNALEKLAKDITASGKIPGIWLAPTIVSKKSLLASKKDLLVKSRVTGEPISAGNVLRSETGVLDLTNPLAQKYIQSVFYQLSEWGFKYFKLDFLYGGALNGKRYTSLSDTEAYRFGLETIKSSLPSDAILLACGAPLFPSLGLVDAMRIGPDIGYNFLPANDHPSLPAQKNALRNIASRHYCHKTLFINDPDCLIVSPNMEQRENWANALCSSDYLRSLSGNLADLDDWGLSTIKSLMHPVTFNHN